MEKKTILSLQNVFEFHHIFSEIVLAIVCVSILLALLFRKIELF
jgi:purine-cytosine permease-like protein